ncbi:SAM-dependent methyltransferase [Streptacidiphilus jiangxiensis]|uniref:S-adenosyl methyltransferase n=1 Tax=Streptacidiphilus jiangxiensis TaxID=235985 RepID=A0A1H7HWV5_STRJI|nr:SAM-dependent methyltransferase [Streptacidiphilus jiangxiensis]SEK54823.1 S-adenosyl methyltransferase [Streptacidiphilus jiangxiensis]
MPRRQATWPADDANAAPSAALDLDRAHPARIYNYLIGGKDHFAADREAAHALQRIVPESRDAMRLNRAFLARAVRRAAEAGISRFLDVGTGIPAPGHTHEVAVQIRPDTRVVYVDRDPLVVTHARALVAHPGVPATAVVKADVRDPDSVLDAPAVAELLGDGAPVALVLGAVLHFVDDADEPHAAVRRLLEPLPSGSMLIVSHVCHGSQWVDAADRARADQVAALYRETVDRLTPRDSGPIEAFFDGLELLPPGLVPCAAWDAEATVSELRATRGFLGGVGVKH